MWGARYNPFRNSWGGHKGASKYKKSQHYRLYQTIAGKWSAWRIKLIELYPCASREELNRREGELIGEMGTLNENIAGRTDKEYSEDNADKIKQQAKQYNEKNKGKTNQYYEKIKQKVKQDNEKDNEKDKEKIKQTNTRGKIISLLNRSPAYRQAIENKTLEKYEITVADDIYIKKHIKI